MPKSNLRWDKWTAVIYILSSVLFLIYSLNKTRVIGMIGYQQQIDFMIRMNLAYHVFSLVLMYFPRILLLPYDSEGIYRRYLWLHLFLMILIQITGYIEVAGRLGFVEMSTELSPRGEAMVFAMIIGGALGMKFAVAKLRRSRKL